MPDTETAPPQQPLGLMQALAPIVSNRPVHIILSPSPDDPNKLHVVCQPARVSDDEDAALAQGFHVDASPAELDAQLPGIISSTWAPAHLNLQQTLNALAKNAEAARVAALDKQKGGGKAGKAGKAAAGSGQTSLLAAPSEASTAPAQLALPGPPQSAATPEPAPRAATEPRVATKEAVEPVAPDEQPAAVGDAAVDAPAPEASTRTRAEGDQQQSPRSEAEPLGAGPARASDGISSLFDD
jgi:PRTRC genetic system protein E